MMKRRYVRIISSGNPCLLSYTLINAFSFFLSYFHPRESSKSKYNIVKISICLLHHRKNLLPTGYRQVARKSKNVQLTQPTHNFSDDNIQNRSCQ